MTDTARDHLERAVAWPDELDGDMTLPSTRIATARAEVRHALELLDAIPPRDPTESSNMRQGWIPVYFTALAELAEKEGK